MLKDVHNVFMDSSYLLSNVLNCLYTKVFFFFLTQKVQNKSTLDVPRQPRKVNRIGKLKRLETINLKQ